MAEDGEEKEPTERLPFWSYGANDFVGELPLDAAKDVERTGHLRYDFAKLCQALGVVPHTALLPPVPEAPTPPPTSGARRPSSKRTTSALAAFRPPSPEKGRLSAARSPSPEKGRLSPSERGASAAGSAAQPRRLPPGTLPSTPLKEGPTLAITSTLLDGPTLEVLRLALPTAHHLQTLRLSGCGLDAEEMRLLEAALAAGETCTVQQLQLDWNPLEEAADAAALRKLGAEGTLEELDELESQRQKRQCERTLRAFAEMLEVHFEVLHPEAAKEAGEEGAPDQAAEPDAAAEPQGPSALEQALELAAKASDPEHAATSMRAPIDLATWTKAFEDSLGLRPCDAEPIFRILDGPLYGTGDGLVPTSRAGTAVKGLAERTPEDEESDPLAKAFAAFVGERSLLEVVSFRCCDLGRVEAQAVGRALCGVQHLRALNLWGNRICDKGAAALGAAFEANFGLQYLGLGKNHITHVGLEALCKPLGVNRVLDKGFAENIQKLAKDRAKEKETKAKAKGAAGPKTDGAGRERYTPEMYIGSCEQGPDAEDGSPVWIWVRNCVLRTLVLEGNPISDAAALERLRPLGPPGGQLVLRDTPAAQELLAAPPPAAPPAEGDPPAQEGWTLVLG